MWISIGVGLMAIVAGSILLRQAPENVQGLFGMACLFSAIALRHVLDGRKLRRMERDD